MPGSARSMGHTGGLETVEACCCLGGRGTTVEAEDIELSEADMVAQSRKSNLPFLLTHYANIVWLCHHIQTFT